MENRHFPVTIKSPLTDKNHKAQKKKCSRKIARRIACPKWEQDDDDRIILDKYMEWNISHVHMQNAEPKIS